MLTAGLVLFGVALFPFVAAPSILVAGILMAGVLSSVIGALTLKNTCWHKHDRCSQPKAKQEAKTICQRPETQEQNIIPNARSQQKYTDIVGKPVTPNQGRS